MRNGRGGRSGWVVGGLTLAGYGVGPGSVPVSPAMRFPGCPVVDMASFFRSQTARTLAPWV
jgi:hypothetical protein